jgi:hypothetical protein
MIDAEISDRAACMPAVRTHVISLVKSPVPAAFVKHFANSKSLPDSVANVNMSKRLFRRAECRGLV